MRSSKLLRHVSVLVLVAATATPARPANEPATRSADLDSILPRWGLGDRWVVETTTRPVNVRRAPDSAKLGHPIQWQFAVLRFEKSLGDDCFRVEVQCLSSPTGRPTSVLWIDRDTMTLKQVEMQLPVPGGFRQMTVNYVSSSGQPSPIMGPLSSLPVDLPAFVSSSSKGSQAYTYEAFTGSQEEKSLGGIGFSYQVEQTVNGVALDEVKGLVPAAFAKGLSDVAIAEVRLAAQGHEVRQVWQQGLPWPVYTENGTTKCRLVSVTSAGIQTPEVENEIP